MAPRSVKKPTGWRNRIVGQGVVDAATLIPHPENWRVHGQRQRKALADALDTVGWVQSVVVSKRTGRILDGHLRTAEAAERGETVPVVYVDLSEQDERLVLATLDPIGAMADTNRAALEAIQSHFADASAQVRALLEAAGVKAGVRLAGVGAADPDEVPPKRATKVKPGHLYALGEHRLLCGSATDPASYERIGAQGAAAVVTDPPYGGRGIQNDAEDMPALRALLQASLGLAKQASAPGAVWYVFAPSRPPVNLAFAEVLGPDQLDVWRASIVWVKNSLVLSRQDYHYRHEQIFYGWTPGAGHHRNPSRDQDSVWEFDRPARSLEHPTMKPVAMIEKAITNSTDRGDLVLDPFLGSGTTLIAAERTGRRCVGTELDPGYCQVIIDRWEQQTGGKAVKL